jgi:uncharacterized membrane protein (UPF0127 family)
MKRIAFRVLCASFFVLLASCAKELKTVSVMMNGKGYLLEVADTEETRERGLMERKSLPADGGMIFVFDADSQVSFWMKNTPLPLSIAFVSKDGVVKEIFDMEPNSLKPIESTYSVRYAIELNKGAFAEAGVGPGDRIVLPEF